jgi:hypothetical protein
MGTSRRVPNATKVVGRVFQKRKEEMDASSDYCFTTATWFYFLGPFS